MEKLSCRANFLVACSRMNSSSATIFVAIPFQRHQQHSHAGRFPSAGAASATPKLAALLAGVTVSGRGVSGILEQQAGGKIRKTTDPEANADFNSELDSGSCRENVKLALIREGRP
jgi:hypothetical protein